MKRQRNLMRKQKINIKDMKNWRDKMNQDIKNLIGLTYEENGKDYKIVGIKEVLEK